MNNRLSRKFYYSEKRQGETSRDAVQCFSFHDTNSIIYQKPGSFSVRVFTKKPKQSKIYKIMCVKEEPQFIMKTQEQQQAIKDYQLKLVELFRDAPEGFNAVFIAGTVDENNDPEGSLTINAVTAIKGKGRDLNYLICSSMEEDPDLRKILNRAVMKVPNGSDINNMLERFFKGKL